MSSKQPLMAPSSEPEFDPHTALIVVDVQNDFAHPSGSLYVQGAERVVPVINALAARATESGAFVVYTQDWHPEQTPHFAAQGGRWPRHCVQNTWGAELVSELVIAGPVIQKGTAGDDGYSGFFARDVASGIEHPTPLDRALREHDVRRVVVVGIAHDVCVKATALDARRLGYPTSVVLGATRAVDPEQVGAVNSELERAGVELS